MIYVLITFVIIGITFLIASVIYLKTGLFKFLYHDILGWHQPIEYEEITFNGCNWGTRCKYCKKKIIQDSQGNWF